MTTYKVMLGLLWTSTKCNLATKFIVKIDDNSVVDLGRLERALEKVDEGSHNILCPFEIRGLPIWRHPEVKFQNRTIAVVGFKKYYSYFHSFLQRLLSWASGQFRSQFGQKRSIKTTAMGGFGSPRLRWVSTGKHFFCFGVCGVSRFQYLTVQTS